MAVVDHVEGKREKLTCSVFQAYFYSIDFFDCEISVQDYYLVMLLKENHLAAIFYF